MSFQSCHISSDTGLKIYGRRRETSSHTKVLALHGWLDNCQSFTPLFNELAAQSDADLLAIDLPGHGFSDHRHIQGSYNIWDDLRDILSLLNTLGWDRVVLVGHSRGAMISLLLGCIEPERFSYITFIDGIIPLPVPPEEVAKQLQTHVRDYMRPLKPGRVYPDFGAMADVRLRTGQLQDEAAALLVSGGAKAVDGGYTFTADRRLHGASAMRLSDEQNLSLLQNLTVPATVLLADQGFGQVGELRAQIEAAGTVKVKMIAGKHHCHMDDAVEVIVAFMIATALKP